MKKQRVPYARRSVWFVIAALSVVLVVGFILAGLEINHLRNQISGLQNAVSTLYIASTHSATAGK